MPFTDIVNLHHFRICASAPLLPCFRIFASVHFQCHLWCPSLPRTILNASHLVEPLALLVSAMCARPSVQQVDLSLNQISDQGAIAIAKSLRGSSSEHRGGCRFREIQKACICCIRWKLQPQLCSALLGSSAKHASVPRIPLIPVDSAARSARG